MNVCGHCEQQRAVLRRPKTFEQLCRECFYAALEEEVHQTILANSLFSPGERVAVAASGGKDSTVLAHMLTTLNKRHGWVGGWAPAAVAATCQRRVGTTVVQPLVTHYGADAAAACCSYGLDLFLLSIDEGISGYRDDSLETVKRNEQQYQVRCGGYACGCGCGQASTGKRWRVT